MHFVEYRNYSLIMAQDLSHNEMSKIQALQQKRTLAFVNHFVTTNVQFLNNFMRNCEQKLMDFENKLEKLNATVLLLEARLSSVPELNTKESTQVKKEEPQTVTTESPVQNDLAPKSESKDSIPEVDKTDSTKTRPEYDRFLKMVQVGVPIQAVKLKISLEGLDPDIFDEILGK